MRFAFLLLTALLALSACEDAPWLQGSQPQQTYVVPNANIEPGETVEVQAGDTVYSVARRYKVSMNDVIAINNLRPPYQLVPGTQITLPAKEIMVAAQKKPAPVPVVTPAPVQPVAVIEAPEAPAANGAVTYHQEASRQQMVDSGEKDVVAYASANRRALASLAQDAAKKTPAPGEPAPLVKQLDLPPLEYHKGKAELKAPVFSKDVAQTLKPGRFIWPVHGSVVSNFGAKANGMRNDGVNIASSLGTPVSAADGGTVAYAGSEIPGYGNVVIIRHPDGFMTTYAHLERILVDKDSIAAKGDVVGTVGTTGGLTSPQLHFEIRKGAEALDPSKYLPKAL